MFVGLVGPKKHPLRCRFQKYRVHRLAAKIFHSAQQSEALTVHILSMFPPSLLELSFAESHWIFLIYAPLATYRSDLLYFFTIVWNFLTK